MWQLYRDHAYFVQLELNYPLNPYSWVCFQEQSTAHFGTDIIIFFKSHQRETPSIAVCMRRWSASLGWPKVRYTTLGEFPRSQALLTIGDRLSLLTVADCWSRIPKFWTVPRRHRKPNWFLLGTLLLSRKFSIWFTRDFSIIVESTQYVYESIIHRSRGTSGLKNRYYARLF